MKSLAWLSAAVVVVLAVSPLMAQQKFPQRWNYVRADLSSDKGLTDFLDLMQQSKDSGCTHLALGEGLWMRMADNAAYRARVDKVRGFAKDKGLTIVPIVYALGYSGRYLGFDPNLAAGLPVKDMSFVVKGRSAVVDPAAALDVSGLKETNGKTTGTVACQPFIHYRISFTVEGSAPQGESRESYIRITSKEGNRWHTRRNPNVKSQDGKLYVETTFNSLQASQLNVVINGKGVSDLKIEPAGLIMVLRRQLCPVKVTSADGKTVYEEGKDFARILDPKLATEHEFAFTHPSPAISLSEGSRIKGGEKLKVSFFHAYTLGNGQDGISMDDPAVFEIMEKDIATCAKVWQAEGYFMNYDEIRLAGWETPDKKPGQILADHVRNGCELVKKYAPAAKIYTWSDMFTPFHNAASFATKGYYYLVNGCWDGSWEGLPKDVIIMQWYVPKGKEAAAMKYFSDRGNPQIICGFYDARDTAAMKNNIANWMKACQGLPLIEGFMYTTWRNNFKSMPEFFKLLDDYDNWSKAVTPKPEKEPGVVE